MRRRSGLYLLAAGLAGVLSLLLVPFETIAPVAGFSPLALRAVAIIQPAVLTVLFVLVGNALAPRVGLGAPLVEALTDGKPWLPVLARQARPAAAGAVAVALILTAYSLVLVPSMIKESESEAFARFVANGPPLATKVLFGGITEELITRWGLMSLFAWTGWRLIRRPAIVPNRVFWTALLVAACLFAAGHLPLLFALMPDAPLWAVVAVLAGNALPGAIFGWLFWKHGIESAILAHASAHVIATVLLLL